MNQYLPYLEVFLAGVACYALFLTWKRFAARWATWFPLLKKSSEWGLIGIAIVLGLYILKMFSETTAPTTEAFLLFMGGMLGPWVVMKRRGSDKEVVKRGTALASAKEVAAQVRATKKPADISFGGVPIPRDAEPYHLLMAGSTGTGKSVSISTLLETIKERGDTVILVDSGGGFLSKYYNPETDFVFNPYDDRCVGWSPTAEMQGAWDAQALARSIVPDGVGDNKEWNNYAQTFISSVLRKLWENGRLTLRDFLYYVQAASIKELESLLVGTSAASQLSSEKTFGSIRTIANNYVAAYDYLPTNKETFSIADMIRAEHSGVLYVTYRDDQLDSLRNIIACLLDVAARSILSLEPDADRRIWLIIDEFASIGKVQSIEQVATKARKNGGCLVLGIQSVSQLKDRYGEHGAQTILSCLSTWLVLRVSDADTAEYMSKYIGEAEVQRTQQGTSASESGETQSWNEQNTTHRVLLASQLQSFKNLHGVLKLAGNFPVCEVGLSFPKAKNVIASSFEARDFEANPLLNLAAMASENEAPPKANSAKGSGSPMGQLHSTIPAVPVVNDNSAQDAFRERMETRQIRDSLTVKLQNQLAEIEELEQTIAQQQEEARVAALPNWIPVGELTEAELAEDAQYAAEGAMDPSSVLALDKRRKAKQAASAAAKALKPSQLAKAKADLLSSLSAARDAAKKKSDAKPTGEQAQLKMATADKAQPAKPAPAQEHKAEDKPKQNKRRKRKPSSGPSLSDLSR